MLPTTAAHKSPHHCSITHFMSPSFRRAGTTVLPELMYSTAELPVSSTSWSASHKRKTPTIHGVPYFAFAIAAIESYASCSDAIAVVLGAAGLQPTSWWKSHPLNKRYDSLNTESLFTLTASRAL